MLIVALVLAVIGLAALVTAVVTSNELVAWVCIGASVIGVVLLIVDALRERSGGDDAAEVTDDDHDRDDETTTIEQVEPAEDYPEEFHQDEPETTTSPATSTTATANDDAPDPKREY